jgi:hypothetical protein
MTKPLPIDDVIAPEYREKALGRRAFVTAQHAQENWKVWSPVWVR